MQLSAYVLSAQKLRKNGYSAIPIRHGEKRPAIKGWQQYCNDMPPLERHTKWLRSWNFDIGICLGKASGIIAVDYDYDQNGLHEKIQSIFPISPVAKRGAKGFTAFYQYTGEKSVPFHIDGQVIVEILSHGRNTTLPPSLHPKGMAYSWLTSRTLENVLADDLPSITEKQMRTVQAFFKCHHVPAAIPSPSMEIKGDAIFEALSYIPSDNYYTWITCGMALRSHFGNAGFPIFDKWSSKSTKYQGSIKALKKWESFKNGAVTIATIFHYASQCGYRSHIALNK